MSQGASANPGQTSGQGKKFSAEDCRKLNPGDHQLMVLHEAVKLMEQCSNGVFFPYYSTAVAALETATKVALENVPKDGVDNDGHGENNWKRLDRLRERYMDAIEKFKPRGEP